MFESVAFLLLRLFIKSELPEPCRIPPLSLAASRWTTKLLPVCSSMARARASLDSLPAGRPLRTWAGCKPPARPATFRSPVHRRPPRAVCSRSCCTSGARRLDLRGRLAGQHGAGNEIRHPPPPGSVPCSHSVFSLHSRHRAPASVRTEPGRESQAGVVPAARPGCFLSSEKNQPRPSSRPWGVSVGPLSSQGSCQRARFKGRSSRRWKQ